MFPLSVARAGQALNALLFLYREVLKREVPWLDEVVRAKVPRRLPAALSREEAAWVPNAVQRTDSVVVVEPLVRAQRR